MRKRVERHGFAATPLSTTYALRDDKVVIECELYHEDQSIEWFINGKPYQSGQRYETEEYAYLRRLIIHEAVPTDSGTVISATSEGATFSTVLSVDETPAEFVRKLERRTTGTLGETLTLTVEISHETQHVAWYKDGEKIGDSTSFKILSQGTTHALQVLKPSYESCGTYVVRAENVESSTIAEFKGAPAFVDSAQKELIIDAHDDINIVADFRSIPEPTVEVFHNGEPLRVELRTTQETTEKSFKLCKKDVSRSDAGVYTVRATNDFGTDTKEWIVSVNGLSKSFSLVSKI